MLEAMPDEAPSILYFDISCEDMNCLFLTAVLSCHGNVVWNYLHTQCNIIWCTHPCSVSTTGYSSVSFWARNEEVRSPFNFC